MLVREDGDFRLDDPLNRIDLVVGDRREAGPAVFENAHDPARLENLDVTFLVHPVADEEVAGEHRDADEPLLASALRPDAHRRQKRVESLRGELIGDQLLAVAVGPDRVPGFVCCCRSGNCQGFAPFGLRFVVLESLAAVSS
jgi:hypothetical protein